MAITSSKVVHYKFFLNPINSDDYLNFFEELINKINEDQCLKS